MDDSRQPWPGAVDQRGVLAQRVGAERVELGALLGGLALRLDLEAAIATMPAKLQRVCAVLMELKPADAAERLSVSRQSVYRYIHQIRGHFF